MLTAKVCVAFDGDWTAQLADFDLSAEILASRFRDRTYLGLLAVETDGIEAVTEVLEAHDTIRSVERVESSNLDNHGRQSATLLLQGELDESTPLKELLQAGYLPLRPATIENGRECFDLVLRDRSALAEATALLRQFGDVSVERITTDYRRDIVPSHAEWQAILEAMPPRRRELLDTAVRSGFFETPRGIDLEELAEREGITKSTASTHLRKAQKEVFEFLVPYLNLAGGESTR